MVSPMDFKLQDLNGVVPFGNINYGVSEIDTATSVAPCSPWYSLTIPTYNQRFSSCVGESTANWIEPLIRKHIDRNYFAPDEQIDGEIIWRRGRELFWKGEPVEKGGLMMDQGFLAAIDLGLLPAGTALTFLEATPESIAAQLQETPILHGCCVSEAWRDPNHDSGEIRSILPHPFARHATCIVAIAVQNGLWYVVFQNSWGNTWGRFGYGMLYGEYWRKQCLCDKPVTVRLPDGWKDHVADSARKFICKRK